MNANQLLLLPIKQSGGIEGREASSSEDESAILAATAELYKLVGFENPWIGYLAMLDTNVVGTCGFKSSPASGAVEIAYLTFAGFEGRGFGTAMATKLVEIARRTAPAMVVMAQTLPKRNASHRILEKLKFKHTNNLEHPEDGEVWEWKL